MAFNRQNPIINNAKGELVSVLDPAGTITYNLRSDGRPSSMLVKKMIKMTKMIDNIEKL